MQAAGTRGIQIEGRDIGMVCQLESLSASADEDLVIVGHLLLNLAREFHHHMFAPAMMPDGIAGAALGLPGNQCGRIACAGIELKRHIGMLERLVRIGGATDTGFHMITCPTKSRIADRNIDGDPSDAGKHEWDAFMINTPPGAASWRTGLALQ